MSGAASKGRVATEARLRWMTRGDAAEAAEIDRASYMPADRWPRSEYLTRLASLETAVFVAEAHGCLVGLGVMTREPRLWRLERLAVAPVWRGLGLGSRLMAERVLPRLNAQRPECQALVDERDLPAQLFLQSQGFRAIGILRTPAGDVYEMGRHLNLETMNRWMGVQAVSSWPCGRTRS